MGWSSHSESRDTGFDSRLGRVTFWSLFLSCRDHFFTFFGTCWEMLGDTVGMFSDGFGMVSGKSCDEVEFSKVYGSKFPASGYSKQYCLADPRTNVP